MKIPTKNILLLGFCLVFSSVQARPPYRLQAIAQFHFEGSPLKKSTMACTFCHINDTGGAPWNPFGESIKAAFRANPKWGIADALQGVMAAMKDSDKDGYEDALEVFAHTLPGDAKSKPKEDHKVLLERFMAAGGPDQYKSNKAAPVDSSDDE